MDAGSQKTVKMYVLAPNSRTVGIWNLFSPLPAHCQSFVTLRWETYEDGALEEKGRKIKKIAVAKHNNDGCCAKGQPLIIGLLVQNDVTRSLIAVRAVMSGRVSEREGRWRSFQRAGYFDEKQYSTQRARTADDVTRISCDCTCRCGWAQSRRGHR